jgi:integrase
MSKRANGEGNVYRRANGTWEARMTYVDAATGRRTRVSFYAATQAAARQKMKDARGRLDRGAPVRDGTRSVGDWLKHWRETTLAVSDRKPATRSLYSALSRKHLECGVFGAISLDRLRPSDIEGLILALRDKGLSDSTVRQVYTVARIGLDGAVRDGLLAVNPAACVQRPGVARREAVHLDPDAVSAVLAAAQRSRYYPALVLVASTAIRRGEALALSWSDVDLDAAVLVVTKTIGRIDGKLERGEVKTQRSRRTIPLSASVVAMLRRHRTTQRAERLRAGDQWTDTGLVFTTELGHAVEPRNLLRVIEAAARRAGVEGVGVHTLRHSAATAWLENGVHIKAVSDLLGHSSVAITGDVYGHASDHTARGAVDGLAAQLRI